MWAESFFHPCLPVFVSSVFPEPRDPGSGLRENTPRYCFITLLIGPGLIPQAPRNRAWQITKGRSLNLSLASFSWGWRNLKRYSSLHTTPSQLTAAFKMMLFPKLWEWKCLVGIASWHKEAAGEKHTDGCYIQMFGNKTTGVSLLHRLHMQS